MDRHPPQDTWYRVENTAAIAARLGTPPHPVMSLVLISSLELWRTKGEASPELLCVA